MQLSISSVIYWLTKTIVSLDNSDILDLEDSYRHVINKLKAEVEGLINEDEKLELLEYLQSLIVNAKKELAQDGFPALELRIKLLANFELNIQKLLAVEISTFKPIIQWNGSNEMLCELLMHLKKMTNSKGDPLINNTVEELAFFLKNNFEQYTLNNTKIKTIERVLNEQSIKIATNNNKFRIVRQGEDN